MFEIFRLVGRIFLEGDTEVQQALDASERKAAGLARRLGSLGEQFSRVGLFMSKWVTGPLAGAGTGALLLANRVAQTADRLLDLSDITGISTDAIQEWQHVSRIAGVSAETVTSAVEGLVRRLPLLEAEGGRATEQLQKLGLSFSDLEYMAPDQLVETLISRLAAMEDPLERNAIGSALFGQSWKDLAPILALGAEGIEAARKEAHELGLVMGRDSLEGANEFRIAMERLKAQFADAANEIGLRLAPVLRDVLVPVVQEQVIPVVGDLADRIATLIEWFGDLDPRWQRLILTAGGFLAVLGPVLVVVGTLATGLARIMPFLPGLAAGFATVARVLAGPFGLAAAGVVAVVQSIVDANRRVAEAVHARAKEIEQRVAAQIAEEKRLALEGVEAERRAAQDKVKAALAATREKLKNLGEEKRAHREALQERKRQIDDEHRAAIDAIRREYGYVEDVSDSKTDRARRASQAVIDALDAEERRATEVYRERMRQLDEQYDAQMRLVDAETRAALEALQQQIDAIDMQARAEERAARQQHDQQRVGELQHRIAYETDFRRRAALQKELADLQADIRRRQQLEARDAQKQALREQMTAVRAEAEQRKAALLAERKAQEAQAAELLQLEQQRIEDARTAEQAALAETIRLIQEERKEKEAAEAAKYEAARKSIEDQLKGLDAYYAAYAAELEREVKDKEAAEQSKLQATLRRLAAEEAAIRASFAEREKQAAAGAAAQARAERVTTPRAAAAARTEWLMRAGTLPGDIAPEAPLPGHGVPALQHGATVTRPTLALIGERRPEAVIPLDPLRTGTARIESLLQAILGALKTERAPDFEGLFKGATIQVRNDQDVRRLAQEIYALHASRARAAGVVMP